MPKRLLWIPQSGAILAEVNMKSTVVFLPFTNFGADPDGDGQFEPLDTDPTLTATSGIHYLIALKPLPELHLQPDGAGWQMVWGNGILEVVDRPDAVDWSAAPSAVSPWAGSGPETSRSFRLRVD